MSVRLSRDTIHCPYLMGNMLGDTMARGRNRSQRDTFDIATPVLDRRYVLPVRSGLGDLVSLLERSELQDVEDRREYHPLAVARPTVERGRMRAGLFSEFSTTGREYFAFRRPDRVPVCIRRQERREVIFAKRHAGKGGRGRRRRYSRDSFVKC